MFGKRKFKSRTRSSKSTQTPASQPSAARVEANRANAQRSTGPNTEEGKARSAQNAVKFGLYSQAVSTFLTGKLEGNRETLNFLVDKFTDVFQPQDHVETLLVDRLASQHWRLHRLTIVREMYARGLYDDGRFTALDVEARCAPFGVAEERLERSLSRQMRDLAFLQRWRPRREMASAGTDSPADPQEPKFEQPVVAEAEVPARETPASEAAGPVLGEPATVVQNETDVPNDRPVVAEMLSAEPLAGKAPPEFADPEAVSESVAAETASESAEAAPSAPEAPFGPPISTRITPHGIHRTYLRDGITYSSTTPFENEPAGAWKDIEKRQ